MTFSEWWDSFYNVYLLPNVVYDCAREYQIIYDKHFAPLYALELSDATPLDIMRCMNSAVSYSDSRRRKVYFLLHNCFNTALSCGLCSVNPVDAVKKPRRSAKLPDSYSSDELRIILSRVSSSATARMIALAVNTGLRRGELLALHWDNVNSEQINVCQTVVRCDGGQKLVNTTKSRKPRVIPVNSAILEILSLIRLRDSKSGFLFQGENGLPLCLRSFNARYTAYINSLRVDNPSLRYLSPHKLRHTFATLLVRSGCDVETLRALLGHSDIATTQIYLHTDFERCKAALDTFEGVV